MDIREQEVRAKNLERLQKKVQDMMIRGWTPKDDIQIDYTTGEVLQTVEKRKD